MALLDQKIGLGIDFSRLDRDLRGVADRIESAGQSASARIGDVAGDLAKGGLDPGEIRAAVSRVGTDLAAGVSNGVRRAAVLMTGLTARIEKMLDKLVGSAVTIFRRIDDAMKFPVFYAFIRSASVRLNAFALGVKKSATEIGLDIAMGLDGTFQQVMVVASALIERLGQSISRTMKEAIREIVAEFQKFTASIQRSEASVDGLFESIQRTATAATRFPKFPPMGPPGTAKRPFPGTGRRLGANVDFQAPSPPAPPPNEALKMTAAFMARDLAGAAKAVGSAALGATTIFARLGAGITGMTIAGIGGLMRLRNFLGKLGDVGKASFHKMFEAHGLFVGAILGGVKIVGALTGAVLRVGTLGAFGKASADVAKFGAETRTSAAQVEALTGKVRSLGSEVLAAFGLAGLIYKAVGFIRDGVMAASDLNEAVSRSKVVFGDSFGAVDEQARRMTRAFGLSHQAQLDIASGFGAMTQGAGFSEAASARLSNQLTKMAADLSSSVNIPFEEAGAALRSALAGEAEPLRRFGVNVTETNVKTYALANGIATSAKSMTDMQKVAARAAIIMNGLSYAQDDLENTASSASNQFRMAGGGIAEFGSRIGEILLPAVNLGTQAFNTFLGAVLDLFEASMPTIRAGMEYLSAGMEMVGMVARNFGDFFTVAKLRVGEFAANAVAWIGTIPENFGPITEWLGRNWWNLLTDMVNLTASAFKNLITNAANLGKAIWNALSGQPWSFAWTPLLDGFKATTEKLPDLIRPDLISVDDEVNRILERIGKKEFERSQALANAASPKKPIVPLAASDSKDSNYRLASAVEVGSKEAYSIVARTLAPGGNDPGRQQVDLIRQTNGILGQIRDGVNKNAPAQFSVV